MTTICADELFRERGPDRSAPIPDATPRPAARPRRHRAPAVDASPRPLRREDFERRTGGLGDLLGGQVFPRLV